MLTSHDDRRLLTFPRRAEPRRKPVLSFTLGRMRFALAADNVVSVMKLEGERWQRMLRLARTGTLGASGLPLIRLATRLRCEDDTVPACGTLVLYGREGRARATLLVDADARREEAEIAAVPAAWRDRPAVGEDRIEGLARLADGRQAALLDITVGVVRERAAEEAAPARDSAHLLVRAGRSELEAVRVAALRGMSPIDERGRTLLLLGGDEEAVVVDEIVGLAPKGRVERAGGGRVLVAGERRYRLLEPGASIPTPASAVRVLLTAPEGEARARLRDLVRSLGHDVSLADDPRAAELAGKRFDVILFDLDAYGARAPGGTNCIGFSAGGTTPGAEGFCAIVPAGDALALVTALLGARVAGK